MRWLIVTLLALFCAATPAMAAKRIAFTFDDIPRIQGSYFTPDERSQRLIAALRQARVKQAAFFLNPGNLGEPFGTGGDARIAAYVAAGHVIANHTNTHIGLSGNSVADYLANIEAAEVWLAGRPGRRPWFRFPYLDEGGADLAKRDALRTALAERGLRNGYVTADGSDWYLDDLVNKAKASGKTFDMVQLKRLYIQMHVSGAEYADTLARETLGRSPAHVMLMHETDIAAMFLPDMVAELRRLGWTVITADEAYRDRLSSSAPDVPMARGDLISAMAREKKVLQPVWPVWIHPGLAEHMFNQRVIKEAPGK